VLHVNRIAEAPALHIPNSLIEIPGGAGTPCPPGTIQVATGQAAPFNTACQVSTVIELTDGRTGFVAGTLAITPTYFNFIKDPEYNAVATPENPTVCTTEAQGCFSPVWMGIAPGPTQVVTVTGGLAPPELTAQGSVSPPTWDLRWDTQGATGFVDLYVGNLTGVCPAGGTCAADKIVGSQVLLNGAVVPSSSDVLPSFTGFTGSVLHLRYPQATAMASLKALAGATLIAGQPATLSLTGVLTSNGLPGPVPGDRAGHADRDADGRHGAHAARCAHCQGAGDVDPKRLQEQSCGQTASSQERATSQQGRVRLFVVR
jgi:hypothetical protein